MSLIAQFDAAFNGLAVPIPDTPLPRLPPRKPRPIRSKTSESVQLGSVRSMHNVLLLDADTESELGYIINSEDIGNGKTRLETTRTTVVIVNGYIVRGRLNQRALRGVRVIRVSVF